MRQFSKIFPGETPGPPPAGGGDPLPHPPPFGASRISEAFGFKPLCSSSFQSCSRGKKGWTPLCISVRQLNGMEIYNIQVLRQVN